MPDPYPTPSRIDEAALIDRARALAPALAERRRKGSELRRLPAETVADLVEAGLFKIGQPKRLGGFELPFGAQTRVSAEIGKTCGSTAWIVSVVATHHWMIGKFEPEAQNDVWGDDPDTVVSSAFAAAETKVEPVTDGYRVSGRWLYSSGVDAASWAMLAIPVPQSDGAPEKRFALVPKQDFRVLDTWDASGLRATGSNDIAVDDAFIPSYRTITFADMDRLDTAGTKANPGPVYRLPAFGVFNLTAVGPVLGLARGALDAFIANMVGRRNVLANKVIQFPTLQLRVSEASAEIDAAWLMAEDVIGTIRAGAESGNGLPKGELLKIQRSCAYAGKLCQTAVQRLADALGAGGIRQDNPVQLALADIRGACAHITMGWDANGVPYGKHLFGLPHEGLV